MSNNAKRLTRSEVPVEQTWNLDDICSDRKNWEDRLKANFKAYETLQRFKGTACKDGETLYQCLVEMETAFTETYQIATYISLKYSADAMDTANQEDMMAFGAAEAQITTLMAFIESEIVALDDSDYQNLYIQKPELKVFKNYIQNIYDRKKHMLSAETEEVLAALGEVTNSPYNIYSMSKATDMQFDSFEDCNGNPLANSFAMFEGKYEFDADKDIRTKAYASFTKTLESYKNTYASVYATEIKKQIALSKLRGYSSVTEMLLEPHKITTEMYENQLNIIFKTLAPHMRRFAKIKEKQLGLEQIRFCDLKAPLDSSFSPAATYDSIRETIIDAVSVMGKEYQEIIKRAYDERWIDYSDNIGKSTGAFCATPYGVHPYILISYQPNMRSAFTLAHELGHAGHFFLANKEQRILDMEVSTYFVEAPSTMNEMLLSQHLMNKTDDPQMKRWVIIQLMGTYYHNFVTHLLEAEFQRRIYAIAEQDLPLTTKTFCDTKLEVIKEFWGDEVEVDEAAGMTWMRQPHYYMGLYPYTYSAGLTISTAMAEMIRTEGQPAVDRWLETLKAGGSLKPNELLKIAGIDMTKPDAIVKAVDYVGSLVSQLEKLYE